MSVRVLYIEGMIVQSVCVREIGILLLSATKTILFNDLVDIGKTT